MTRKSSRNLVERSCGDEKDSDMYRKEGLNLSLFRDTDDWVGSLGENR